MPTSDAHTTTEHEHAGKAAPRRGPRRVLILMAAGVLAVAAHLALGGSASAALRWTGRAADVLLAVALVKLIALSGLWRRLARIGGPGKTAAAMVHGPRPHGPGPTACMAHRRAGHVAAVIRLLTRGRRSGPVSDEPVRSQARVPTSRSERYARQLCAHAARMAPHAEWNPPEGRIEFPDGMGTCRVTAEPGGLVLTIEATSPANLTVLQQIIGRDIERFARREGLTVSWHRRPAEEDEER